MRSSYASIDLSYLDLMSDGDVDMKKMMLEMLLDEIPQEISKMKQLLTASNWKDLRQVSHKMKSTLSFVGNDILTNANKEIEDISKSEIGTRRLPMLVKTMEQHYPETIADLKEVLSSL